ncbi:M23 family metallopeptidase [Bacteriovorax sp. PP10]|uniref:M23 family metallopeptidase n=1 Tax=Bacteriovorax antarcticus TaxID=3088717 RepID=A0ABU5VXG5_9BACT|nr:M23 family metallopeptidase [Bacteriovorax sp. PP10]MEA9357302.1 M23 family metallopeptidase [Bacteriovorax sp. PP10]
MSKFFLCFVFLISFTQRLHASEKAFNILLGYGFKEDDLAHVVKKYPELNDLELASGSNYQAPEESDESHVELKLYSEKTNEAYIVSKSGSDISVERNDVQFDVEVKVIEGAIRESFYDSVMSEFNSPVVATQVSEAFKDEFTNSKGLKTDALYSFQIEQYFDHGQFIKYGNVLSASLIVGKAISKKNYQLNPENFSWMLLSEHSVSGDRPFYLPVNSKRVTSLFQLNRRHPVKRTHQPHNGIDFGAPNGTPIYPALDGEVITISRTRSKGKFITIRHDNGYLTTYIHLKKYAPGLKVGKRVELDEKIGEVGRTGFTTGAHLHFGVIKDGYFVNPIYLVKNYPYSQKDQHLDSEIGLEEKAINNGDVLEDAIEE